MIEQKYNDLKDKNILITGGGSGIGASFVKNFCQQGAKVAFISIDSESSTKLCNDIETSSGYKPVFIDCDITDTTQLKTAIHTITQNIGNIDVLINNAANDNRHQLDQLSVEEWDALMNVNLRPHFFTAQAIAKGMKQAKQGSIINIGSNSSLLGLSGYPAYVAAKAGIIGLSKALARELGASGIRVNTLIPGWVMTERQKQLWATPEAVEACLEQQCLKSTIVEQDIANAGLFLASSASKMMTGQTLIVDGGRV